MVTLRAARASDMASFYAISLLTGHLGADASHLYDDPKMMGHIYSAPYLIFLPELCFVAEDEVGVAGFIVGTADTVPFEDLLEEKWWPGLRQTYAQPDEATRAAWSPDQRRGFMIHHPDRVPDNLVTCYPAHLHMNLLPRIQGRGVGPALLKIWCGAAKELGVHEVHVGANGQNSGAVKFWQRNHFEPLADMIELPESRMVWLGRNI